MSELIYPIIKRAAAKQQGLKYYFTGKPCKYGHTAEKRVDTGYCVVCNQLSRKKCQKEYQKSDNFKEYQAEYRKLEKCKQKSKEYRTEYLKSDNHKKNIQFKKLTDPMFMLKCNVRRLIRTSIKRGGFKKSSKTAQLLGCSFEDFKFYIENLFTEGMSWDNYGEWHYDHIYPISLALNKNHLIELNHYTNIQPLWAIDNLKKGNKLFL